MRNKNRHENERGVSRIGAGMLKYLPPPPILDGEDDAAYKALRAKIFDAVKPKDIFEEIFADDIANLQWEVMRWRRLKVALMNSEQQVDARQILLPLCGHSEIRKVLDGWARQDPEQTDYLKQILALKGVSMDALAAKTLARRLDHVERIDTLASMAEARRGHALKELGQHRERFAKILQSAIKEVEDGEFTEIKPANGNVGAADAA